MVVGGDFDACARFAAELFIHNAMRFMIPTDYKVGGYRPTQGLSRDTVGEVDFIDDRRWSDRSIYAPTPAI